MNNLGYFLSDLSSLVPVWMGIYYFKRLEKDRRLILYFLIYVSVVELTNAWMAINKYHNLWSINIYTLLEYSFYTYILNRWLKGVLIFWITLIGSILFFSLWFGYFLMVKNLNLVNTGAEVTENVVLMLLCLIVMISLSMKTAVPVFSNYKFWFCGISFIYFAMNVSLSLLMASLLDSKDPLVFNAWHIHTVINIVKNFVYACMFLLVVKRADVASVQTYNSFR